MRFASASRLPSGSVTSSQELRGRGIGSSTIDRYVHAGALIPEPGARGVYRLAGRELSLHHDLLVVALYAPSTVFCLLTALAWHELRGPCADIWLSVPAASRTPALPQLPLTFIRPRAALENWETHKEVVEEVPVQFTSAARTVADCFRYRTRVGLDVAVAALQAARRNGAATMEDIWRCAKASGVERVMLPYMESV